MQKPLAWSGIAWCRPPVMLALWRLSPLHTCRNASAVAPTTWDAARCMSWNTGLSSLPSPWDGTKPSGSLPASLTASIIAGSWTVAIRSSPAIGAGTVRTRSRTPSSRARRIVRSTRIGDMGWLGPKSYSVRVWSKTTVAGPGHAGMPVTLPVQPGTGSGPGRLLLLVSRPHDSQDVVRKRESDSRCGDLRPRPPAPAAPTYECGRRSAGLRRAARGQRRDDPARAAGPACGAGPEPRAVPRDGDPLGRPVVRGDRDVGVSPPPAAPGHRRGRDEPVGVLPRVPVRDTSGDAADRHGLRGLGHPGRRGVRPGGRGRHGPAAGGADPANSRTLGRRRLGRPPDGTEPPARLLGGPGPGAAVAHAPVSATRAVGTRGGRGRAARAHASDGATAGRGLRRRDLAAMAPSHPRPPAPRGTTPHGGGSGGDRGRVGAMAGDRVVGHRDSRRLLADRGRVAPRRPVPLRGALRPPPRALARTCPLAQGGRRRGAGPERGAHGCRGAIAADRPPPGDVVRGLPDLRPGRGQHVRRRAPAAAPAVPSRRGGLRGRVDPAGQALARARLAGDHPGPRRAVRLADAVCPLPAGSAAGAVSVVPWRRDDLLDLPVVARLTADPDRAHPHPRPPTGGRSSFSRRSSGVEAQVVPGATHTQEPP